MSLSEDPQGFSTSKFFQSTASAPLRRSPRHSVKLESSIGGVTPTGDSQSSPYTAVYDVHAPGSDVLPVFKQTRRHTSTVVKLDSEELVVSTSGLTGVTLPRATGKRSRATKTTVKDELLREKVKVKVKRGFAPPEQYAHLRPLQDYLGEELDVLFCGINPGEKSALAGHHFANPTNHFWRCLAGSHLTDRLLSPSEDHTLPHRYNLGMTNLVERPSKEENELAPSEFTAGVPALLQKLARFRPRIVCFVGKGIWEAFERAIPSNARALSRPAGFSPVKSLAGGKRALKPVFRYDIQPYKVVHSEGGIAQTVRETLFFVMPSTSGRVTSHQLPQKTALFALMKQRIEELKQGSVDTSSMAVIPSFSA